MSRAVCGLLVNYSKAVETIMPSTLGGQPPLLWEFLLVGGAAEASRLNLRC